MARLVLRAIGCQNCGRYFMTERAEEMIASIVGACPRCGGAFAIVDDTPLPGATPEPPESIHKPLPGAHR
jgi:DNA-directed RNA polymerase subunit RPC12/RpoP